MSPSSFLLLFFCAAAAQTRGGVHTFDFTTANEVLFSTPNTLSHPVLFLLTADVDTCSVCKIAGRLIRRVEKAYTSSQPRMRLLFAEMFFDEHGPSAHIPGLLGVEELPAIVYFRPRGMKPAFTVFKPNAVSHFEDADTITVTPQRKKRRFPHRRPLHNEWLAHESPESVGQHQELFSGLTSQSQPSLQFGGISFETVADFLRMQTDGVIDIRSNAPRTAPPKTAQSSSGIAGFLSTLLLIGIVVGCSVIFIKDSLDPGRPARTVAHLRADAELNERRGFWFQTSRMTFGTEEVLVLDDDCEISEQTLSYLSMGSLAYSIFVSGAYLVLRSGFPAIGLHPSGGMMFVWPGFRGQFGVESLFIIAACFAVSYLLVALNKAISLPPVERYQYVLGYAASMILIIIWLIWLFRQKHGSYMRGTGLLLVLQQIPFVRF